MRLGRAGSGPEACTQALISHVSSTALTEAGSASLRCFLAPGPHGGPGPVGPGAVNGKLLAGPAASNPG